MIAALELGAADVHAAVSATLDPPPSRDEVEMIVHVLNSAAVDYRSGEPEAAVTGRILDLIEAIGDG